MFARRISLLTAIVSCFTSSTLDPRTASAKLLILARRNAVRSAVFPPAHCPHAPGRCQTAPSAITQPVRRETPGPCHRNGPRPYCDRSADQHTSPWREPAARRQRIFVSPSWRTAIYSRPRAAPGNSTMGIASACLPRNLAPPRRASLQAQAAIISRRLRPRVCVPVLLVGLLTI
jgi:hypothetical protein